MIKYNKEELSLLSDFMENNNYVLSITIGKPKELWYEVKKIKKKLDIN